MLTLHTKWRILVPWGHESAYAETVAAAGASDLLLQASTNGLGHCNFSPSEIGASVALLESWAETGVRPSAATVAAFGLDAITPPGGCLGHGESASMVEALDAIAARSRALAPGVGGMAVRADLHRD